MYGDGRSEQRIASWRRVNPSWRGTVATKMIRRAPAPTLRYASYEAFREWTDRSRRNLDVDTLDLVQLHCPTDDVYAADFVFDALDALVDAGSIAAYGVSVPPMDTLTNSTPSVAYFSFCDTPLASTRSPMISAASVIAAGSVMNEPISGTISITVR